MIDSFTQNLDVKLGWAAVTELELPVATQLRNKDVKWCRAFDVFNVKPKDWGMCPQPGTFI